MLYVKLGVMRQWDNQKDTERQCSEIDSGDIGHGGSYFLFSCDTQQCQCDPRRPPKASDLELCIS